MQSHQVKYMENMTGEAPKEHANESLDETQGEYDILALLSKKIKNGDGEDSGSKIFSDGKLDTKSLSIFYLSENTM